MKKKSILMKYQIVLLNRPNSDYIVTSDYIGVIRADD